MTANNRVDNWRSRVTRVADNWCRGQLVTVTLTSDDSQIDKWTSGQLVTVMLTSYKWTTKQMDSRQVNRKNDETIKKLMYTQQGNTLLEILLVISIMSIFLFASIPNIKKLFTSLEQEIALDRIKNAVELAKHEALGKNQIITLCPSYNQTNCSYGDSWDVGFIMFINPNRDTQPDKGAILKVFEGAKYGRIIFDAMGNQLNIQEDGSTTNIGNFIYCSKEKGLIKPKGLVLNWVARLYITDSNPNKSIEAKCDY